MVIEPKNKPKGVIGSPTPTPSNSQTTTNTNVEVKYYKSDGTPVYGAVEGREYKLGGGSPTVPVTTPQKVLSQEYVDKATAPLQPQVNQAKPTIRTLTQAEADQATTPLRSSTLPSGNVLNIKTGKVEQGTISPNTVLTKEQPKEQKTVVKQSLFGAEGRLQKASEKFNMPSASSVALNVIPVGKAFQYGKSLLSASKPIIQKALATKAGQYALYIPKAVAGGFVAMKGFEYITTGVNDLLYPEEKPIREKLKKDGKLRENNLFVDLNVQSYANNLYGTDTRTSKFKSGATNLLLATPGINTVTFGLSEAFPNSQFAQRVNLVRQKTLGEIKGKLRAEGVKEADLNKYADVTFKEYARNEGSIYAGFIGSGVPAEQGARATAVLTAKAGAELGTKKILGLNIGGFKQGFKNALPFGVGEAVIQSSLARTTKTNTYNIFPQNQQYNYNILTNEGGSLKLQSKQYTQQDIGLAGEGLLGGLSAGIGQGLLLGFSAGKSRALTKITDYGLNIADPSEAPADFLADVSESIRYKRGRTIAKPIITFSTNNKITMGSATYTQTNVMQPNILSPSPSKTNLPTVNILDTFTKNNEDIIQPLPTPSKTDNFINNYVTSPVYNFNEQNTQQDIFTGTNTNILANTFLPLSTVVPQGLRLPPLMPLPLGIGGTAQKGQKRKKYINELQEGSNLLANLIGSGGGRRAGFTGFTFSAKKKAKRRKKR